MIYTVTFNPSIDYMVSVPDFQPGKTNRATEEYVLPGGKGINVSAVLKNLGVESVALGFVAGFTGEEIARRVSGQGISNQFIRLEEGMSRINVKLQNMEGTEINGGGPEIPEEKLGGLVGRLRDLQTGDVLILSGSIPASVPVDIYSKIAAGVYDKGVIVVADATGEPLLQTLKHKPFLIKPNLHELEMLFDVDFGQAKGEALRKAVIPYGCKLQKMGALNVLISLGGDGAVLIAENGQVYTAPAPEGNVVNAVGAGDSMVAGFMAGWLERADYGYAFGMGIAAGSASAFSRNLATKEEVLKLYGQTAVKAE